MSNFQQNNFQKQFTPAQLFKAPSRWYIQYYAFDPFTNQLKRKTIKVNRIQNLREREKYAKTIVNEINRKLYAGWNPFVEKAAPKSYHKLYSVLDTFIRTKGKELKNDSMRTYKSFVRTMKDWLIETEREDIFIANFTDVDGVEFLNYIYNVKDVSNLTYNNYLRFCKVLFNWLVSALYCRANPFENMKTKIPKEKFRTIITETQRDRIGKYLQENEFTFYIASMLLFHSMIRPNEITYLKPEHFNLENQTIIVPGHAAKNRKMRVATIPDVLLPHLERFKFNNAPDEWYIFGEAFKPSPERANSRMFGRKWAKLRKRMNIPMEIQFYSLRDTGIVQMMNDGISPQEVMKQADHSSLEITTTYAKHANPKGSEQIKGKSSGF